MSTLDRDALPGFIDQRIDYYTKAGANPSATRLEKYLLADVIRDLEEIKGSLEVSK